jgi:hypothetical protein
MFSWALGFGNWNVRPQIFAYFWMVILLVAIHQVRVSGKRAWFFVFPGVMILWVNMHGSYPLGLVVIACWLADELWQAWRSRKDYNKLYFSLGVFVASTAACVVNPRGFGAIQYLNTMTSSEILKNFVLEWLPPTFDTLEVFLLGLLSASVILAVSSRRPSLFQVLIFLVFGTLGLRYIRGAVWFGMLIAGPLSEAIAPIISRSFQTSVPNQKMQRANIFITLVLGILAFVSLPWFKQYWPVLPEKTGLVSYDTPVEATQYILDHALPGRLFHNMSYGSYLIWAAQPNYRVFVDSRIELFPTEIWMDYLAITNAQMGWEDLLNKYQVNTLMLGIIDQYALIQAVELSDEWEKAYSDKTVVIFYRP